MKFQIPNVHHSKVNRRTHAHTDRQAESNMPFQLFQSWGHKQIVRPHRERVVFFSDTTRLFSQYIFELLHEKTNNLHMRKQRRSYCTADQRLCFRHSDSTIPILLIA